MKNFKNYISLVICGTGGQGIFTLTRLIHSLCDEKKIKCLSSSFKGGAQKHGSVHSEIKIFNDSSLPYEKFSVQLLPGELDVLIATEPHECLRFQHLFHPGTKLLVNSCEDKLYVSRFQTKEIIKPVELIRRLELNSVIENFTEKSLQRFGNKKMLNYCMMEKALENQLLPFTVSEFNNVFNITKNNQL